MKRKILTNTGYIVGSDGVILKTTNQGSTWTVNTSTVFPGLVKNAFVLNENVAGVISGGTASGMIRITTDGGNNWLSGSGTINSVGSPGFIWLRGLCLVDENTYYVCGNDYGMIGMSFTLTE